MSSIRTPGSGSVILTQWRAQRETQRALMSPGGGWSRGATVLQPISPGTGARTLKGYMAASNDRLVADLMAITGFVSGNAEVRHSLRTMRMRSRQLANDNEYVKRFLQMLRNGVVGPRGFELQMKIYKGRKVEGLAQLDKDANDLIEEAHVAHSKLGVFSACGQHSRATFERAAITCLARDGELLIEKLVGRQFGRFGLAWRLLDPDLLDESLNLAVNGAYPGLGKLSEGNSIRMGVERNAYGRPVAYWFHNVHPGDDLLGVPYVRHRRVLADRIIHRYFVEEMRPDTVRGVPWIYAALRRMAMLGGYEEAALVTARQGASKMGFYKRPAEEKSPVTTPNADGTAVSDDEDAEGNLIQEAEPGVFGVLPGGWDFTTYDPAYPNDKMADFVEGMLRAFCSSVGFHYNGLTGDLRNVSLSALRHGSNNDRDTYEVLQQWFKEQVCECMFEPWLSLSLDLAQIGRLPAEAFDRLNKPRFIARTFRSPDPQKDIAARAQEVALGTNSRTRICAENGVDFEEVLEELAREEQMAREKKVSLSTAAATASKNPPAAAPKPSDGEGEPAKDDDDDTPAQGATEDEPA